MLYREVARVLTELKDLTRRFGVVRALRVLRYPAQRSRVLANPAFQRHIERVGQADNLFFLSYRDYLARGLSARQRTMAALTHYQHEVQNFDGAYFAAVYNGEGLELWRTETESGVFDIRLVPGADVVHEGGASVIVRFNGQRLCVISYSMVLVRDFLPAARHVAPGGAGGQNVLFVTRKQLNPHPEYHKVFSKVFGTTVGYYAFAAVAGIAMAQGHRRLLAISPRAHPACKPELQHHFDAAYTTFWESLMGTESSPFGFVVPLPIEMTPLDGLTASRRKRAMARRSRLELVVAKATESIERHLLTARSPPAGGQTEGAARPGNAAPSRPLRIQPHR